MKVKGTQKKCYYIKWYLVATFSHSVTTNNCILKYAANAIINIQLQITKLIKFVVANSIFPRQIIKLIYI